MTLCTMHVVGFAPTMPRMSLLLLLALLLGGDLSNPHRSIIGVGAQEGCPDVGPFQARIVELEREVAEAGSRYEVTQREQQQKLVDLETQVSDSTNKVRDLESLLDETRRKAETDSVAAQSKIDAMQEALGAAQKEKQSLSDEVVEVEGLLKSLNDEKSASESRASELQTKLDAVEDEKAKVSSAYEKLKSEHEVATTKASELQKSLDKLKKKVDTLQSELKTTKQQNKQKVKELEDEMEQTKVHLMKSRKEALDLDEKLEEIEQNIYHQLAFQSNKAHMYVVQMCNSIAEDVQITVRKYWKQIEPTVGPIVEKTRVVAGKVWKDGQVYSNKVVKFTKEVVFPSVQDAWLKAKPKLLDVYETVRAKTQQIWDSTSDHRAQLYEKAAPILDPVQEHYTKTMAVVNEKVEGPKQALRESQKILVGHVHSTSEVFLSYLKLQKEQQLSKQKKTSKSKKNDSGKSGSSESAFLDAMIKTTKYVYENSEEFLIYIEASLVTLWVILVTSWFVGGSADSTAAAVAAAEKKSKKVTIKVENGGKNHHASKNGVGKQAQTNSKKKR